MAIVSTGQYTIVDYNDAITLVGFVNANQRNNQTLNPDNGSYIPSWSSTNVVCTAQVFKAGGSSVDILSDAGETGNIVSQQWYDITNGTEVLLATDTNYTVSGKTLTIKQNLLTANAPGKDYMHKLTYKDPTTQMQIIIKTPISFTLTVNGTGIAGATVYAIGGNTFKNGTVTSIDIQAELWRGALVDTTSVTYEWAMKDASVTTTGSTGYSATFGLGWKKLTDVVGSVINTTTSKITVYPTLVQNFGVFQVAIKDTDSASNTYNTVFKAQCTVLDQSDPIMVVISSTGGDTFKNGVGTSTLKADLFQNGVKITNLTGYTFRWCRYDKDGILDPNFGGAGVPWKNATNTNELAITDTDVTVKATFGVEVNK